MLRMFSMIYFSWLERWVAMFWFQTSCMVERCQMILIQSTMLQNQLPAHSDYYITMQFINFLMPPKPWETRKKPTMDNISQIIQSNPTVKEEVPKIPADSAFNVPNAPLAPGDAEGPMGSTSALGNTATANTTSTNGYGSGYGSSYGSGYGGGYGSSYGGYGGLGSSSYGGYGSYGMGGMGGMYGGMGRMGMMGNQNQQGFLFQAMMALQSFTYLINSLCEIARSMDQNYEGLSLFYKSFKNLISKMQNGMIDGLKWVVRKIKNLLVAIFDFIIEKVFFMGKTNLKSKYRAVKMIMSISIICVMVSFYPLLKKGATALSK